jgi:hypothetical protein
LTAINPGSQPRTGPKIFVHVGEPKTGTTYLQQLMFSNQRALARQGVILPGTRPRYHFRATQDLRGVVPEPSDPLAPFEGAWDKLVAEALAAPRVGLVTHELLSSVTEKQADRAVASFGAAEVHIVISVRDFASLLPAEWQETIKNRNTTTYEAWLTRVIDHESVDPDRRRWWFWKVHDTLEILRIWGRHIPPERIHVITVPPRGSAPTVLWDRYSKVVGIDPKAVDTSAAKSNSSLSVPQIELIRRMNLAIPGEMPDWFYMHFVKGTLAHNAFADRPEPAQRLGLPAEREEWALNAADALVTALASSGYEIVGDLKELRPAETNAVQPLPQTTDEAGIAESGVIAVTAVLSELQQTTLQFMAKNPDAVPESWLQVRKVPRGPVKNFIVEMSERHRSMHALRSGWWRIANKARRVRSKQPSRGR